MAKLHSQTSGVQEPVKINKKKILFRLWNYLYEYKLLLFTAVFLTIISNLLALVSPRLSGLAVDAMVLGEGKVDFERVFYYSALMIAFYLLSSILSYVLARLMISLTQKVVYRMRQEVFQKLLDLPVGFFDQNQTGDIISRISYDIDVLNTSLSSDLIQIATSLITVIGSFIMMITISSQLVIVFLFTIPISIIFTSYMSRKVRPLFRRRSRKLGELNGYVEENVSGQKTIKAYHQEKTMINRFDSFNEAAVQAYYQSDYYGTMVGPSVNLINNLSLSLVSVLGALLYLWNSITIGDLSAFVLYSRKFSGPINEIANIISELQSSMAAAERIFRLLDEESEPMDLPGAEDITDVEGKIDLDHVDFGYTPEKIIIKDLNIKADPGKLVAIVGPTGAGKTTIINLLMRFYDPNNGEIRVDDTPIMNITRKSLRRAYTMVLQDTWLFNGTIFENIAYGKQNATMEEVVEAAKIHSFITRLPQGYNTLLNEDGVNISKGQKQLLTIARAMLIESNMLILDEATSNVDTRTEMQIQAAMYKLMQGKTCFVIAHRLSTIQHADIILVVKDGNVIEQGKHQELLDKEGFYYKLYNSQFQ
ncbi:ABC transporter ATP-binding protein [Alloiococcus sp. CFN-8]|uniref:ABC transporter ATP-binding protein n=1 Tax=Alloiococcus sp. CFN-8 TaxID=3416081 RepID=UPI003CEE72E2